MSNCCAAVSDVKQWGSNKTSTGSWSESRGCAKTRRTVIIVVIQEILLRDKTAQGEFPKRKSEGWKKMEGKIREHGANFKRLIVLPANRKTNRRISL